MTARVAVCVSTHERPDLLARLLAALEAQTLPADDFEVCIVDDGSSPAAWEAVQAAVAGSRLTVRLQHTERSRGPAAGRNLAWRASSAPVVAFTDDDCRPVPHWLETGLADLGTGRRHLAGAARPAPEDMVAVGPYSRSLFADRTHGRWFAAANLFIPRASLEAVGGFDERFPRAAGEDTDLNLRLEDWGSTFVFSDHALVHHDVIPSGVWRAVRDKRRWSDLARVVKAHPRARTELLTWRVFWKRDHAFLLLLLAGLTTRRPSWALALAAPWVHARTCHGATETRLEAAAVLPGELVVGLAEIAAMLEGSVRNRTLVL